PPEVRLRRGLDAGCTLTEVDGVEVALEDGPLPDLSLEPVSQHDLAQLATKALLGSQQRVLHELLGDGRTALADLTRFRVMGCGADHALEVDAPVMPER